MSGIFFRVVGTKKPFSAVERCNPTEPFWRQTKDAPRLGNDIVTVYNVPCTIEHSGDAKNHLSILVTGVKSIQDARVDLNARYACS